jgi:hypothetical protein
MNCCYATGETSCTPKGRANCDRFKVECSPYDGPRYTCGCSDGGCVGRFASAGSGPAPSDGGAAAPSQPSIASGDLAASAVLDVIMKHAPDVRACRAKTPKTFGLVTVGWNVRATGAVDPPRVISAQGVDPALGTCLTKKISGWRFPKAKGPTHVTYGFRFS